jgi:hypothetical protein
MITYKLVKNINGEVVSVNSSNGLAIPFDPANTDYQAYLAWLNEGNEPEAAN